MTAPQSFTVASDFMLEFDGQQIGSFKSFSGLKVSSEAIKVPMTVQGKQVTVKTMGNRNFEDLTLERHYDGTSTLFTWYDNLTKNFDAAKDKKTGAIYTMDKAGKETSRWDFEGAFPIAYESPEYGSDKNEAVTEKVTISVDFVKKTK